MWQATILTLFPEMFPGMLGQSLAGQAKEKGVWSLKTLDIRDFSSDKHRTVDDTPFGGGAGMVLKPDVVDRALNAAKADFNAGKDGARVIYMTPRGAPLTQEKVQDLVASRGVIVLCGRYEGVDQRVLDAHAVEEISVGDYVLSGGEPAALVMLDACIRLLPGVMGNTTTADEESFSAGLLEYPHYTRPANWDGRTVPEVLLSGHHERVADWRRTQAETVTRERRPDLWEKHVTQRADKTGLKRDTTK